MKTYIVTYKLPGDELTSVVEIKADGSGEAEELCRLVHPEATVYTTEQAPAGHFHEGDSHGW